MTPASRSRAFEVPFATADRVAVLLLAAASLGLLVWEWPRLSPLLGPADGESSVTAAMTDARSRRCVRVATGAAVAVFVGLHLMLLVG